MTERRGPPAASQSRNEREFLIYESEGQQDGLGVQIAQSVCEGKKQELVAVMNCVAGDVGKEGTVKWDGMQEMLDGAM